MIRLLVRSTGAVTALGLGAVGYEYATGDPNFRRSVTFWKRTMPMYLHYRYVEWNWEGLSEEEQNARYEALHDKYAPESYDLVCDLKGFYTKIGQMTSTRDDFMPKQYLELFKTLQSDGPQVDFDVVKHVFKTSTGKDLDEVFEWVEEKPLGAASIGQVHRGKLRDGGREVVMKVMFPEMEEVFHGDLSTMKRFCYMAQPEHYPALEEIEKQFETEFDYRGEAENLRLVRAGVLPSFSAQVDIPEPLFATKHILIMSYLPGPRLHEALMENLENVARLKGTTSEAMLEDIRQRKQRGEELTGPTTGQMRAWQTQIRLQDAVTNTQTFFANITRRLAGADSSSLQPYQSTPLPLDTDGILRTLFEVHAHEIFVNGAFNGDPHPGNILWLPDTNRLGLIDYGQVKRITAEQRIQLARLIWALHTDDKDAVVRAYKKMGYRSKHDDDDITYAHAYLLFNTDDYDSLGLNIQVFLEQLEKNDAVQSMPDEHIMAMRVAILLRGLAYALQYRVRVADLWAPYARRVLEDHNLFPHDNGFPLRTKPNPPSERGAEFARIARELVAEYREEAQ